MIVRPHTSRSEPAGVLAGDLKLVRGVLSRTPRAVERFVTRIACVARMVAHHNRRLGRPLRDQELADVCQEIALAILRKLDQYDGSVPLEAWVYRFCQLELYVHLRRENRLPRFLADLDGADDKLSALDAEPFRFESLHHQVEQLPAEDAAVLRLKHFAGLTFLEIATELEISTNTAKTRYYRALDRLRRGLAPCERTTYPESRAQ